MRLVKISAAAALLLSTVEGSVDITFDVGGIYDASGSDAPLGSYSIFVVDKNGDGFLGDYTGSGVFDPSVFVSTTLTEGNLLGGGGDDEIIGAFTLASGGTYSKSFGNSNFLLEGGLNSNDEIGLYWFPGVTTSSIEASVSEYGFYRNSNIDTESSSEIGFVVPSDGANVNLFSFSQNINPSGIPTKSDLTAVPEPSSYATILGLLGLAYAVSRRRRRSGL